MHATSPLRGFTLIELLVVVLILAGVLVLVPVNLYQFGSRSRLENASNTLVSLVGAAREQAILDGQPVRLELGLWKDDDGDAHHSHRLVFTNLPVQKSELLNESGEKETVERPKEREWLSTPWRDLGDGIAFVGISERSDNWQKLRIDQPYVVEFGPDGSVAKGFAIRVESLDLEEAGVKAENRSMTVIVNPLTAEAHAVEGLAELPPQRDENEFSK